MPDGFDTRAARRAVFLDRDGVLNAAEMRGGRPYPPTTVANLVLLPGVEEACRRLHCAGFVLVVVTNQPDIARGTMTHADVEAIHTWLSHRLPIDEFVVCPHDDADGCPCRKPRPGMLVSAAARLGIDLASSTTVGDRWRDIAAGRQAGTRTVWLDRGYAERTPDSPNLRVGELIDAVEWIVRR